MNSTPQLDVHPDAESLNAFAEQALPERERGRILAHLAVCGRCRQVIFLAQEEADGMEMVAAAAAPAAQTRARSGSWLSGWRLAWIPAAALAASVAVGVLVHVRHEQPGTETAKVTTPVAPQNEARIERPLENKPAVARKMPAPASPIAAKSSESKAQSTAAVTASAPNLEQAAPPPAATTQPVTVASAPPFITAEASGGQGSQMAEYKPAPIPGERQQARAGATYSSHAAAAYAPSAKKDEMAERAPASRSAEAQLNGSGGAYAAGLHQEAVVPRYSYDARAHIPAMRYEAAREATIAPLPSGLPVVSTVTAQDRTLAIDQAGAVFLSQDSGEHWEAVARQWTGRAVSVSLARPVSGGPSSSGTAAAAVFELVNNKNQIWVSTDGMSWKAQ